jgi:hypothetical protein
MSDRFQLQQYDGQIYLSERGTPVLQAEIRSPKDVEIQIGASDKVEIDKVYGPMVFWNLRVSCDLESGEWIIERQMGPLGEWREWTRIPGQLETDFIETSE